MRALWLDRPNRSHNVSQKVKRIRRVSEVHPRFERRAWGPRKEGAWRAGGSKGWQRVGERLAKGWRKVGEGLAKGWRKVGERLAKGWRRVGTGLAKGWQRVGGFPCTLQFCNSRGARLEHRVCDSMDHGFFQTSVMFG